MSSEIKVTQLPATTDYTTDDYHLITQDTGADYESRKMSHTDFLKSLNKI